MGKFDEYKKVHNTLLNTRKTNVWGYRLGQRIVNAYDDDNAEAILYTSAEDAAQYMVQIEDVEDSITITFIAYDEDGNKVSYFSNLEGNTITASSDASYLITLPIKKKYISVWKDSSAESYETFTPSYIKVSFSEEVTISVWKTRDSVAGYVSNNIITEILSSGEYTPEVLAFFCDTNWLESVKELVGNYIHEFVFTDWDDDDVESEYTVTFPEGLINSSLQEYLGEGNANLVLIPYRCNSSGTVIGPLKSITNTRNSNQFDLYNTSTPFVKCSAFLQPIIVASSSVTLQEKYAFYHPYKDDGGRYIILYPTSYNSDYVKMGTMSTERGNTAYYLQSNLSNSYKYALILCSGCGYEDGESEGYTYITFRLGIQRNRTDNGIAHSGCSLLASWRITASNDVTPVIQIPRRPLASNTLDGYPLIII